MSTQLRPRAILSFLGVISSASLPTFSAEPNLSGEWIATIDTPGVSTRDTTLKLEQIGEKLSGYIVSSSGREEALTGIIVGAQIQFSRVSSMIRVRTEAGDKFLTLNYSGLVNNDEIEAKATVPLGESSLKAKRK
jgi:hypothetical protein